MPCTKPLKAWQSLSGGPLLWAPAGAGPEVQVPCGQCIGCRLERSRQWAVRCMHEAQMNEWNEFVTLTYEDDKLPYGSDLIHKHFQDFMKRLRHKKGIFDVKTWSWTPRYFMCGEYGEARGRPHFHALLFGIRFADRKHVENSADGSRMYESEELNKLWGHGLCRTGEITWQSASYVTRYVTKKMTGENTDSMYEACVPETGEIITRQREYARMSLNPAIGKSWWQTWGRTDSTAHDQVVMNGVAMKPPKYYDKLLKMADAEIAEKTKNQRIETGKKYRGDNTEERLRVKEDVLRAKLQFKKRKLQ